VVEGFAIVVLEFHKSIGSIGDGSDGNPEVLGINS
jgi:hypothetical protein